MELRRFNQRGMQAFRDCLAAIRNEPGSDLPTELLFDPSLTSVLSPTIDFDVPKGPFADRRIASEYLHSNLQSLEKSALEKDDGLWSWMSAALFRYLCPVSSGIRVVRADYTYILDSSNLRLSTRHLLHLAWRIPIVAPQFNRLLLDTSFHSVDSFTDKIMKNLQMTRIPCIFEVLDRIYWDINSKGRRKGVVHSSKITAGDLTHRFPLRISQLELTYDLSSLTSDQLIELLGEEFQFDAGVAKQMQLSLPEQ